MDFGKESIGGFFKESIGGFGKKSKVGFNGEEAKWDKSRIACFSGYRPHKFDFPLIGDTYDRFAERVLGVIMTAVEDGYDTFIFGGCPGFDIIAAELVVLAKRLHRERVIRLVCALPYENFKKSKHFDSQWRERYDCVMEHCDEVINVSGKTGWFSGCYDKRNKFMIDNSSLLICYSTGKHGGSENTVAYAKSKGVAIINVATPL